MGVELHKQAGVMDKKRLDYYKKKLLTRRDELLKTIARTAEEGRLADEDPTVDLVDKAANSYTKEFLFGISNTDRTILNLIDAALKRIQNEEYGVCANCQQQMQQKRLEAVPAANHGSTCQEKAEKAQLELQGLFPPSQIRHRLSVQQTLQGHAASAGSQPVRLSGPFP